jgi:hypothetical protein
MFAVGIKKVAVFILLFLPSRKYESSIKTARIIFTAAQLSIQLSSVLFNLPACNTHLLTVSSGMTNPRLRELVSL